MANLWGLGNGWIISYGGVFKITLAGKESLVYTFKGDPDGANPYTNLIQGSNGDFYGTTEEGGTAQEGTIFEVTAGGKETVLYSFPNQTDGAYPSLPLTQGPNGLLFGAATDCAGGGCSQAGLFDITTEGAYKNLYLYPLVCSNCGQPEAPLLLSTNGTFYSTTEQGGIGVGSFYSLNDGYSPFISLVNVTSGAEGAQVGILGQGFSSKSVVEFGGTKATTTKLTGTTYILATVPAGALTGDITVTTGSTVLSTTASYKITPTYKSFAPLERPSRNRSDIQRHRPDPNHEGDDRQNIGVVHGGLRFRNHRDRSRWSRDRQNRRDHKRWRRYQFHQLHRQLGAALTSHLRRSCTLRWVIRILVFGSSGQQVWLSSPCPNIRHV